MKKELLWLNEFTSFEEAREPMAMWIRNDYNRPYVHSSLGYRSPEEYRQQWDQTHRKTLLWGNVEIWTVPRSLIVGQMVKVFFRDQPLSLKKGKGVLIFGDQYKKQRIAETPIVSNITLIFLLLVKKHY